MFGMLIGMSMNSCFFMYRVSFYIFNNCEMFVMSTISVKEQAGCQVPHTSFTA